MAEPVPLVSFLWNIFRRPAFVAFHKLNHLIVSLQPPFLLRHTFGGFPDLRINGFTDPRKNGFKDSRINGSTDIHSVVPLFRISVIPQLCCFFCKSVVPYLRNSVTPWLSVHPLPYMQYSSCVIHQVSSLFGDGETNGN